MNVRWVEVPSGDYDVRAILDPCTYGHEVYGPCTDPLAVCENASLLLYVDHHPYESGCIHISIHPLERDSDGGRPVLARFLHACVWTTPRTTPEPLHLVPRHNVPTTCSNVVQAHAPHTRRTT